MAGFDRLLRWRVGLGANRTYELRLWAHTMAAQNALVSVFEEGDSSRCLGRVEIVPGKWFKPASLTFRTGEEGDILIVAGYGGALPAAVKWDGFVIAQEEGTTRWE